MDNVSFLDKSRPPIHKNRMDSLILEDSAHKDLLLGPMLGHPLPLPTVYPKIMAGALNANKVSPQIRMVNALLSLLDVLLSTCHLGNVLPAIKCSVWTLIHASMPTVSKRMEKSAYNAKEDSN